MWHIIMQKVDYKSKGQGSKRKVIHIIRVIVTGSVVGVPHHGLLMLLCWQAIPSSEASQLW